MYVPAAFEIDDPVEIDSILAAYPFGILLTNDRDGLPFASHIPMLAQRREGALVLLGHVARANPQSESIRRGEPALAIFSGPHAYISPNWYEPPYPQVPTWNYIAIHAGGHLREAPNPRSVLAKLTHTFEARSPQPWQFELLDDSYVERQIGGIVTFELAVARIDGKAKLSQNRNERDRSGAIAGLAASENLVDRACAEAMRHFATSAREME